MELYKKKLISLMKYNLLFVIIYLENYLEQSMEILNFLKQKLLDIKILINSQNFLIFLILVLAQLISLIDSIFRSNTQVIILSQRKLIKWVVKQQRKKQINMYLQYIYITFLYQIKQVMSVNQVFIDLNQAVQLNNIQVTWITKQFKFNQSNKIRRQNRIGQPYIINILQQPTRLIDIVVDKSIGKKSDDNIINQLCEGSFDSETTLISDFSKIQLEDGRVTYYSQKYINKYLQALYLLEQLLWIVKKILFDYFLTLQSILLINKYKRKKQQELITSQKQLLNNVYSIMTLERQYFSKQYYMVQVLY